MQNITQKIKTKKDYKRIGWNSCIRTDALSQGFPWKSAENKPFFLARRLGRKYADALSWEQLSPALGSCIRNA